MHGHKDQSASDSHLPDEIPVLAEEMKSPPLWATLDARQEDKKWDDLEEVRLTNDKRWLTVYGWVLVVITVAFSAAFLGAFVVLVWHYLTPWTWLDDPHLNKIQSILFSGGMGAVVTSMIRTQIEKSR